MSPTDEEAIESLHVRDVRATLSGRAEDLAELWDQDAVRLLPGEAPEVGRAAIYASDRRHEEAADGAIIVSYVPVIHQVHIVDGWAFEWGTFSARTSQSSPPAEWEGRVLRVLKRQSDGSWKFAVVMVHLSGSEAYNPDPDHLE